MLWDMNVAKIQAGTPEYKQLIYLNRETKFEQKDKIVVPI
jgi:hypothetical protein